MTLTPDQACDLIDYIEALEERCNVSSVLDKLRADGTDEAKLDAAAKTLGKIAGRTFSIL
jgi:hypothetical protein